jgi:hypothetical protein
MELVVLLMATPFAQVGPKVAAVLNMAGVDLRKLLTLSDID